MRKWRNSYPPVRLGGASDSGSGVLDPDGLKDDPCEILAVGQFENRRAGRERAARSADCPRPGAGAV